MYTSAFLYEGMTLDMPKMKKRETIKTILIVNSELSSLLNKYNKWKKIRKKYFTITG